MKKISVICVAASILLTLIVACIDRLDVSSETELIGIVVEKSTNSPLSNIVVQVTDGRDVYSSTATRADGSFSLTVNFNKISDSYYLLLDGSPDLPSKRENLHGMGNKQYDYGYVVLYDKTDVNKLPKVFTGEVRDVMEHSANVSGMVSSSGGYPLRERGICYATHPSPNVDDLRSSAGVEIGSFNCNLLNLQKNVTYYVRAYAINSIGVAYGEQESFSTDGKPTVITIKPICNGTTVTTGGDVTSDGGKPVTARGVCYGITPYPDLSSSHHHTTDNSGVGTFNSSFVMTEPGVYYVRAYATNANGTTYGNQDTVKHPYFDLPTFTFGGHTIRVAPPATNQYNWQDANTYCDTLQFYGCSDWRLPSKDEMSKMCHNHNSIGGFVTDGYWWSGSACGNASHYEVYYSTAIVNGEEYEQGYCFCVSNSLFHSVRPIRVEN